MAAINALIRQLNRNGVPVIFIVTGNNSSGKTTIARRLIRDFEFYQSINLGVASKMMRFFRPDIDSSKLENFEGKEAHTIFMKLLEIIVDSYIKTGVNIIIDGVQVDTMRLSGNRGVLGGVILEVGQALAIQRGDKPETHFKRSLTLEHMKRLPYHDNQKFKRVTNESNIDDTYNVVVLHLEHLLKERLAEYE